MLLQYLINCAHASEENQRTEFNKFPNYCPDKDHIINFSRNQGTSKTLRIFSGQGQHYGRFFLNEVRVIIMTNGKITNKGKVNLIVSQTIDLRQLEGKGIHRFSTSNEICLMLEEEILKFKNPFNSELMLPSFFKDLIETSQYSMFFPKNFNLDNTTVEDQWESIYQHLRRKKQLAKNLSLNIDCENLSDDSAKKNDFVSKFYYAMCFPYHGARIDLDKLFSLISDEKGRLIKMEENDLYYVEANVKRTCKDDCGGNRGYNFEYKTIFSRLYIYKGEKVVDKLATEDECNIVLQKIEEYKV